jgi:hypothetical protein
MQACAAQNEKLLPKSKKKSSSSKERLKASVSKYFPPSTEKK